MKTRNVLAMLVLVLFLAIAGCGSPAPAATATPPPPAVVNVQPTAVPTVPPTAVAQVPATTAPTVAPTAAATAALSGIANPASVFCVQQGGKLDIRKDAKGGEVGYCVFPDKSECEEWAFMRGECKPGNKPTAAAAAATPNPFAYCATAGNLDAPDARWTGAKQPDVIVRALMKAMKLPADAPVAPNVPLTVWRCMNGKVYGCNIGANIPCSEKADVKTMPSSGMTDYCKSNPTSDFIPAYVTGRATVYEWKCSKGLPAIVKELTKADARGFLSIYWYELTK